MAGYNYYWARSNGRPYDHETDFRYNPIDHSGRHRFCRYRGIRYPVTYNEIKAANGFAADDLELEEYSVRLRSATRRRKLPTSWDDIPRAWEGKSWKLYRKKQWHKATD